eukprot:6135843-Pleurochrysis_carterae.AAC.3
MHVYYTVASRPQRPDWHHASISSRFQEMGGAARRARSLYVCSCAAYDLAHARTHRGARARACVRACVLACTYTHTLSTRERMGTHSCLHTFALMLAHIAYVSPTRNCSVHEPRSNKIATAHDQEVETRLAHGASRLCLNFVGRACQVRLPDGEGCALRATNLEVTKSAVWQECVLCDAAV